ncbi:hypothetical protein XENOCAPTIV_020496, partial [Xenoophorus captivus]
LLACTAEAEGLKMKSRLSLAAPAPLALLALVLLSSSQAQDQGEHAAQIFYHETFILLRLKERNRSDIFCPKKGSVKSCSLPRVPGPHVKH